MSAPSTRAKKSKVTAEQAPLPASDRPRAPVRQETLSPVDLGQILLAQLWVAWAGESGDPREAESARRSGWWRSNLLDPATGVDKFKRLFPRTLHWALLEAVRAAARHREAALLSGFPERDRIISLFHLGAEFDRQVDEHLARLKRSHPSTSSGPNPIGPVVAFPSLRPIFDLLDEEEPGEWDPAPFVGVLAGFTARPIPGHSHGITWVATPRGREVQGTCPRSTPDRVRALCAVLANPLPTPGHPWPFPHFLLPEARA
jgi:hypothetical protein